MAVGQVIGGRYELGEQLGRGGMAEVHRATDLRLNRVVAIKQLLAPLAADASFQERFRREAQAAASLNHPNIAAVYDTGEHPGATPGTTIPYIVMELVEGSTLRSVAPVGETMDTDRALQIMGEVLDALGHSHQAGIVHRDIKPGNVMLTPTGVVKVMDFGIARAITDTATNITETAAVIGTAQYLSPEQARGEVVDQRSDLYSAGCLMYELLVGRPPFVGESPLSLTYQHVNEPPPPPSGLKPDLGAGLDTVLLKALAKDPNQRYQTAAEMRADIDRVRAGLAPVGVVADGSGQDTEPMARVDALPTDVRPTAALPVAAAGATAVVPGGFPVADPAPLLAPTSALDSTAAPAAEPPRRRRTGTVLLLVAVIAILAGLGWAVLRSGVFGGAGTAVEVPAILGSTRAVADAELRAARLAPQVEIVRGEDDDTVNTVVDQQPMAGAQVEAGTTVVVTINVGTTPGQIPDGLVGRDVERAVEELEEAGFTAITTRAVAPADADDDEGEVVAVNPAEGSTVGLGEEVVVDYLSETAATADPQTRRSTAPTSGSGDAKTSGDETSDDKTSDDRTSDDRESEPPEEEATTRAPTRSATADKTTRSPTATSTATRKPTAPTTTAPGGSTTKAKAKATPQPKQAGQQTKQARVSGGQPTQVQAAQTARP